MHTHSLPPTDRDEAPEPFLSGDALRERINSLNVSNSTLARGIGKSETAISQWKNGKYPGDNKQLEVGIREWLRDRTVAQASGVKTIETEVSRAMVRKIEEARKACAFVVIVGEAGVGKSRGESLYVMDHTLAIWFRTRTYCRGMRGLRTDLCRAADVNRLGQGESWWDKLVESTRESGRPLIIGDAHELCQNGLQCCIDLHEDAGIPLVLSGLPILEKRLMRDTRRTSRVDELFPLTVKDPLPLIGHLIDQLTPEVNGERAELTGLCQQVFAHEGAFRAVEKQLKRAASNRSKNGSLSWVEAFRAAHKRLPRNWSLPATAV